MKLHYALPYVQMTHHFKQETGVFPGMADGDPVFIDYDLWVDVLEYDAYYRFERAVQLAHGIHEGDK